VLDAIAFERADLLETLAEGDGVDVVARVGSREWGGYESLRLDVRDVAPAGTFAALHRAGPPPAIASAQARSAA
jgi:hypothetical protein